VIGYLKIAVMLLLSPPVLLFWCIRAAIARARFRAELQAAGVPQDAAKKLSGRYGFHFRDLRSIAP
jgi:hypothetical protein